MTYYRKEIKGACSQIVTLVWRHDRTAAKSTQKQSSEEVETVEGLLVQSEQETLRFLNSQFSGQ